MPMYLFLSLASSLSSFSAIVDDSSTLLSSSVLDCSSSLQSPKFCSANLHKRVTRAGINKLQVMTQYIHCYPSAVVGIVTPGGGAGAIHFYQRTEKKVPHWDVWQPRDFDFTERCGQLLLGRAQWDGRLDTERKLLKVYWETVGPLSILVCPKLMSVEWALGQEIAFSL